MCSLYISLIYIEKTSSVCVSVKLNNYIHCFVLFFFLFFFLKLYFVLYDLTSLILFINEKSTVFHKWLFFHFWGKYIFYKLCVFSEIKCPTFTITKFKFFFVFSMIFLLLILRLIYKFFSFFFFNLFNHLCVWFFYLFNLLTFFFSCTNETKFHFN